MNRGEGLHKKNINPILPKVFFLLLLLVVAVVGWLIGYWQRSLKGMLSSNTSENIRVTLVPADTSCYMLATGARRNVFAVRIHPNDFTYELRDSRGSLVPQNLELYDITKPSNGDWVELDNENEHLAKEIGLDGMYPDIPDGQYSLSVKLHPVLPDSPTVQQWFGAIHIWRGPEVNSNRVKVHVHRILTHPIWRFE